VSGSPARLELELIHKSYGTNEVLRGFSGAFEAGRIAALIGPNGAGKTTLLRIAAGLQHADSGVIRAGRVLYYGGLDLLPLKGTIDQLRRALGMTPSPRGSRKLSKLSRGEVHRVGLDMAFDLAPDALLLDEPWTALEPDARETLNEELRAQARNRVIVCSSHDLSEVARVADDVVFLANGVGIWKRRDEADGLFDREELLRIYRESKGMP
jgi:ABC-type multidrug transport system ATPase subunit